jgi:hypothetical protein
MAWDSTFKNTLKKYLGGKVVEIITETDVPTANLRIDFIIRKSQALNYPFNHAKDIIIGEFKSERDKVKLQTITDIFTKCYSYLSVQLDQNSGVHESNICAFLIIGGRRSIPEVISKNYEFEAKGQGIYVLNYPISVVIVLLDQLRYDKTNLFLGMYSGKKIREKILKQALLENEGFIISTSYFLYKDELIEVAKASNFELDQFSINIRSAVETLGIKRVINEVGLKQVIDEIGLKQVIDEIGLKQVIDEVGIEVLANNLTLEQKEQLKKYIG